MRFRAARARLENVLDAFICLCSLHCPAAFQRITILTHSAAICITQSKLAAACNGACILQYVHASRARMQQHFRHMYLSGMTRKTVDARTVACSATDECFRMHGSCARPQLHLNARALPQSATLLLSQAVETAATVKCHITCSQGTACMSSAHGNKATQLAANGQHA
jgi:hypothetical protein